MSLIVQKYGGTSVGTPERIRAVAQRVVASRRAGHDLVVVVSAMGQSTDELLELAAEVLGGEDAAARHPRELDMLLTAGERISMALLAMAIRAAGADAVSLTGSQAAIITDEVHTAARIVEVRAGRVREAVEAGKVAIVAGFQGVSRSREVTTLGRGGSDTTAVALAVALKADRCEIYTDVRGVYTADPRRVPEARIIPEISFDEMLELAVAGAQVMHSRAIEIASRYGLDVWVGSSFEEGEAGPGTLITRNPRHMEEFMLTGITGQKGQAKLVVRGLPGGMRTATELLVALAEGGISVDVVNEAPDLEGRVQLQVTLGEAQVAAAMAICEKVSERRGGGAVEAKGGLTRVVLVGTGMHHQPGIYARAFRALLDEGAEVFAISTSGISITLLVGSEREEDAIRALHRAFELELKSGASVRAAER
jgi:aspartate kinase